MILECQACTSENRVPASRITSRARCGRCKAPLCPALSPLALRSTADFAELVRDAPVPVVVDFWADWCVPCRAVAPQIEALAREKTGQAVVAKVDTEALPDVAARWGIRSIPTMILFQGGRETKRISGAMLAAQIAQAFSL